MFSSQWSFFFHSGCGLLTLKTSFGFFLTGPFLQSEVGKFIEEGESTF